MNEEVTAPHFSFVLPAYNVETYIGKALDSILQQPFGDYEIIVVDDGSTDGTTEILAEYASRDGRISVHRQENSGQGAARSVGLDLARGTYVWCVDSDDWIQSDSLARVAKLLSKHAPDVMVLNFAYAFEDGQIKQSSQTPADLIGRVVDPLKDERTFSSISCWVTPPWRLVIRRTLLEEQGIRFPKGLFYEDHPFAIRVMTSARRAYVDSSISYFYLQRQGSTVHSNDKKVFDFLPIRRECIDLLRRCDLLARFPAIASSYIAPASFVQHHVPESYRRTFFLQLAQEVTDEERHHVALHGDNDQKLLFAALDAGDETIFSQSVLVPAVEAPKASLVARGRRRIKRMVRTRIERVIGWGIKRFGAQAAALLRSQLAEGQAQAVSNLPMEVGAGTTALGVTIDVRVNPEPRNYLVVGKDSQVSGYYVFERGLGRVTVGDRSSIGHGCMFVCSQDGGITIGSHVMLSWNCTLIDSNSHSLDPDVRANDAYDWLLGVTSGKVGYFKDWSAVASAPIVVEDQAWIGFNSSIMKGVTIGKGAVVAANSVITRDVPAYTVFGGNPARFIRFVPRRTWGWEEIVTASRVAPEFADVIKDSYLGQDVIAAFDRFMSGDELPELIDVLQQYCVNGKGNVLDIGGGSGIVTLALAINGYTVTLVEKSDDPFIGTGGARKLLAYAEENYPEAAQRMKIVSGAFEDVQFSEQYDIVYCRQVVHHFMDPKVSVSKIAKILKPEGIFFAVREHVVWDAEDKERFLRCHPYHKYYGGENAYTLSEYGAIIRSAGLDLVRTFSFFETKINFAPRTVEDLAGLTEQDIAGCPYSFLSRKPA